MRNLMILAMFLAVGCSIEPEPLVHDEYPQLCDAKLGLIEATCEHEVACGSIAADEVEACVTIYAAYFGWSGCGYVPVADDAAYRACFADVADAKTCDSATALPKSCEGIFEPGELVDP